MQNFWKVTPLKNIDHWQVFVAGPFDQNGKDIQEVPNIILNGPFPNIYEATNAGKKYAVSIFGAIEDKIFIL